VKDIPFIEKISLGIRLFDSSLTLPFTIEKYIPPINPLKCLNSVVPLDILTKEKNISYYEWGYSSPDIIFPDKPYDSQSVNSLLKDKEKLEIKTNIRFNVVYELIYRLGTFLKLEDLGNCQSVFRLLGYVIGCDKDDNISSSEFLNHFFFPTNSGISVGESFHNVLIQIIENIDELLRKRHINLEKVPKALSTISTLTSVYRLLEIIISFAGKHKNLWEHKFMKIYEFKETGYVLKLLLIPHLKENEILKAVDNEVHASFSLLHTIIHINNIKAVNPQSCNDCLFNYFKYHFKSFCFLFKNLISKDSHRVFPLTFQILPVIHHFIIYV
jgi:hypothetical protein